jgi:hypothetical protein
MIYPKSDFFEEITLCMGGEGKIARKERIVHNPTGPKIKGSS